MQSGNDMIGRENIEIGRRIELKSPMKKRRCYKGGGRHKKKKLKF